MWDYTSVFNEGGDNVNGDNNDLMICFIIAVMFLTSVGYCAY